MTGLILDIIILALLMCAFLIGSKVGLVKSVWGVASWVLAAILTFILFQPLVELASGTRAAVSLNDKIYAQLQESFVHNEENKEETPSKKSGLPEFLLKDINTDKLNSAYENTVIDVSEATAEKITMLIIRIATGIALFILIKIILAIAFAMLNAASKLPVINSANKLLGGLIGIINALFIIYIACAVASLLTVDEEWISIINSSYIAKYFYNNNILMQLMLRM